MASSLVKTYTYSDSDRYLLGVLPYGTNALSNTGSNIVTFILPRENYLVGSDIIFHFSAEADGDAASNDVFNDNIASIWRSLRVKIDGSDVQYIQNLGHLQVLTDN